MNLKSPLDSKEPIQKQPTGLFLFFIDTFSILLSNREHFTCGSFMPIDFSSLFLDLGLSSTETRVYLSSFKLGPTSVQCIAKDAGLSRTATYDVVSQLQERGLMSTFERGKKKFFTAEDPERAVSYFRRQAEVLGEHVDLLQRSLDEMRLTHGGGARPTVRFYEGSEALYTLFADLVEASPDELLEFTNVDVIYENVDREMLLQARKALDETKVKIKALHQGPLQNPRPGAEYCRLLPAFGDISGQLWIYGDRVAFVEFIGCMVTIIIESKVFADLSRTLFHAAWAVCRAQPVQMSVNNPVEHA